VNPLKTIQRNLSDGFEYVQISFTGSWYGSLEYQMRDQDGYRQYLAYMCGYPEEDFWRVVEVLPRGTEDEDGELGVTLIVKFASAGKCLEKMMKDIKIQHFRTYFYDNGDMGVEDAYGVQRLKISKEAIAWETFKNTFDRWQNGEESSGFLSPSPIWT
jgi:hypothetical protein